MRIDGTVRSETTISDDGDLTGIRRRHPWIVNYNDLVVFLLQCNTDTKFIGSGEDAKALVYYFTDYITKAPLSMHVGLAALCYAVNRSGTIMKDHDQCTPIHKLQAKALTATVNGLLSKQEISHQLVMAHFVGGGDHYTSDTYRVLHWSSFNRYFFDSQGGYKVDNRHTRDEQNTVDPDTSSDDSDEALNSVTLSMGLGTISATNQQFDYILRPSIPEFEQLCLYDYVRLVERITVQKEVERTAPNDTGNRRGRQAAPRGRFLEGHPQAESHLVRLRFESLIPVIIGPSTPHSNRSERERGLWARMMCILFVPWRKPTDLCRNNEEWTEALHRHKPHMSDRTLELVCNITTLAECRNAKKQGRRRRAIKEVAEAGNSDAQHAHDPMRECNTHDKPIRLSATEDVFDTFDEIQVSRHETSSNAMERVLSQRIGDVARGVLDFCFASGPPDCITHGTHANGREASAVEATDISRIEREHALMNAIRKERPLQTQAPPTNAGSTPLKPNTRQPTMRYDILRQMSKVFPDEMNLISNPEQLRAFNIIANHVSKQTSQLLMYIAGVGGTGKSHIIQAVRNLFHRIGR
ncbi:hypothetical protein K474DRAFT_1563476, partial [Panus rudis PR-1116 ss-1]